MGPGWLGFPSIVLGKEKGADRKMRLFQGIDSVTAMVQRGWGAVERQRRGGPEQEREAQETKWVDLDPREQPLLPHLLGIPGSGLEDSRGLETERGRNREAE